MVGVWWITNDKLNICVNRDLYSIDPPGILLPMLYEVESHEMAFDGSNQFLAAGDSWKRE